MDTRKVVLSILGLLLIIASVFVAKAIIASKFTPKPQLQKIVKTVFVDTVKNGTVPIKVPANGNLIARQRVELYSEVQGVFRRGSKLFKTGQLYNAGETIIRIDGLVYSYEKCQLHGLHGLTSIP